MTGKRPFQTVFFLYLSANLPLCFVDVKCVSLYNKLNQNCVIMP